MERLGNYFMAAFWLTILASYPLVIGGLAYSIYKIVELIS